MGNTESERQAEIYKFLKGENAMRKWIFALILCMVLILSACRPAGENELPAGSEGSGETQQTEQGGTSEGETQDPQTPATDQTEDPETESPAIGETDNTTVGETGTPVEDETGTPTETHECTYTEDPELRAQAESIYDNGDILEYVEFCLNHEIKIYRRVTEEHDFKLNELTVVLRKECSAPGKAAPDFAVAKPTQVEEVSTTKPFNSDGNYRQTFILTIPSESKAETLVALEALMQLDCVLMVEEMGIGQGV